MKAHGLPTGFGIKRKRGWAALTGRHQQKGGGSQLSVITGRGLRRQFAEPSSVRHGEAFCHTRFPQSSVVIGGAAGGSAFGGSMRGSRGGVNLKNYRSSVSERDYLSINHLALSLPNRLSSIEVLVSFELEFIVGLIALVFCH